MSVPGHILVGLLRVYRAIVSPVLGALCAPLGLGCRYTPTCSQYALEAMRRHGAGKGSWLALARLLRCHPWGGSGEDPVPENWQAGSWLCPHHRLSRRDHQHPAAHPTFKHLPAGES